MYDQNDFWFSCIFLAIRFVMYSQWLFLRAFLKKFHSIYYSLLKLDHLCLVNTNEWTASESICMNALTLIAFLFFASVYLSICLSVCQQPQSKSIRIPRKIYKKISKILISNTPVTVTVTFIGNRKTYYCPCIFYIQTTVTIIAKRMTDVSS